MAEQNIQMNKWNGSSWDQLFPKTKAQIVNLNDGRTVQEVVTSLLNTITTKIEQSDLNTAIDSVIGNAPETLNTLGELANAINDDPNFATTIQGELDGKVTKVSGKGLSTNDFTNALSTKLNNLPSSVYSKTEVDNLIDASGSGIVVSGTEPADADMWFEVL